MIGIIQLILIIFFTKELIVINDDFLISILFLFIMFLMIKTFSFLGNSFEKIKSNNKDELKVASQNLQQNNDLLYSQINYWESVPSLIDIEITDNDYDFSQPIFSNE